MTDASNPEPVVHFACRARAALRGFGSTTGNGLHARRSRAPKPGIGSVEFPGCPDEPYVFVKNNGALTIAEPSTVTFLSEDGSPTCICDQTDLPMGFLSWFPQALRDYMKPPTKGGLPAGSMTTTDADVEGEMLCIQYFVGLDGNTPGYDVLNRSRPDRGDERRGYYEPQQIGMRSDFLFAPGGPLELIEALGEKYRRGEL